jgi:hypothetical protein
VVEMVRQHEAASLAARRDITQRVAQRLDASA